MQNKKLVVFTGAGVSAESGLKTFRDSDGLWENYRVEDVATPMAWQRDPELVLRFYNERRRNILEAQPNAAHTGLAELQQHFEVHIITQNIDDLHERAGSKNVLHLHGEIFKMRSSVREDLIYPIQGDIHLGETAEDGAQLRPHIVWFHEMVPMLEPAIRITQQADFFVVIGTSLLVYPAASLVQYAAEEIPVFVLDKQIPAIRRNGPLVCIEETATRGIGELGRQLLAWP